MARSRFHRSADALPPLRLTPRDDAILRDIDRLGPSLVEHLRALHFPSYKTAAERAMKLFHHQYLERLPLEADAGQPAMAHVLAAKGIERLAAIGVDARPPLDADAEMARVQRAVELTGVLTAFVTAARHPGIELPAVEASPRAVGDGFAPDALVVLDVPARLFRRVLLLDIAGLADDPSLRRARFAQWAAWAARTPQQIERELADLLAARGVPPSPSRARVSIGLVIVDDAGLDGIAEAAVQAGCGPLLYLTTTAAVHAQGPLADIWTQARLRAAEGAAARRTGVLA